MKLGLRLLILVLLAALPVLALQVQDLVQTREQRKAAIAEQALDLARLAAAQQDQFIESARYLLAAAAQFPEVQDLDREACSARMKDLLRQFPTITGIGATGADGVPFCSDTGNVTDSSAADQPYFQRAVRDRSLAISGYTIGQKSGRPHLKFAYPALDDAGEVRAVVILGFSLERLADSLLATPLPSDATMSLVDGDSVLLARAPAAPEWVGRRVREAPFTEAMLARREGVIETTGLDGIQRVHGFAPLLATADLFAVVGLPWQEAYRQADRLFWRETLLTVLAFTIAALVALFSADLWIRRPLTALQDAVARMREGDLSVRAGAGQRGSPELRELAGNFNDMARALERRQAAVEASEARFRAVVETAADGIITINAAGIIQSINPEGERLFGYARDELVGRNVKLLMPSPDAERHDEYLARYLRTGEARIIGIGREVTGRRKDGSTFPLFLSIGEFRLDGERYFTGIVRDITERRRAEERQRLLTAEVDHRAKNLLATIQAMVLLTKRDARSVGDFATTLIGRLHAMGRAHDLLARDRWTGASLRDIIRSEFQAFAGADGARYTLVGEDARLSPRAAQTLSLALHELTTNAVKHGALSVPEGRVEIRATMNGEDLQLTWTETGGPEVKAPAAQGFGSVIVERSIAHELGGNAELRFEPGGLRCHIRIPLRQVAR
ncbi:MAG TPA: PAS domain S-box protein [Geminicoccaceae bacterium]|nr:PAS domain S-box protein [Geminicoccaceae bacterium]